MVGFDSSSLQADSLTLSESACRLLSSRPTTTRPGYYRRAVTDFRRHMWIYLPVCGSVCLLVRNGPIYFN